MKRVAPDVFRDEVRRVFDPALGEHGFYPVGVQQKDDFSLTRYESPSLFVDVVLIMPDYEPTVRIGRKGFEDGKEGRPFDLSELLYVNKSAEFIQVPGSNDYVSAIEGLKKNLLNAGAEALRNDVHFFNALVESRARRMTAFKREELERSIRSNADQLWSNDKKKEAVDMYKKLQTKTKTEMMRVKYVQSKHEG